MRTTIETKDVTRKLTCVVSALLCASCLETTSAPEPIHQTDITHPDVTDQVYRVYLQDNASGFRTKPNSAEELPSCKHFAQTADELSKLEDGEAYNCFIQIESAQIKSDVIETTNDLFQLCVDSGYCQKPNPYDNDKASYCNPGEDFASCPVANVAQDEASRFCTFSGRRLPTALEHVLMRQVALPTATVAISQSIEGFPSELPPLYPETNPGTDNPPNCNSGTVEGCSAAPKPSTIAGEQTVGSVSGDKVNGIYDLTGNLTEWALDRVRPTQVDNASLPWFCERSVEESPCSSDNPADANGCAYVMGNIVGKVGLQRICIASPRLAITNGNIGLTVGGNYREGTASDPTRSGIFSNVLQPNPDSNENKDTIGFRCVSPDSALVPLLEAPEPTLPALDAGVADTDAMASVDAGILATDAAQQVDSGSSNLDAGTSTTTNDAGGTGNLDASTSTTGSDAGI
ncbi:MAG: SUMF1/EgtB/PvdO family nonheme iron enzyme [Myxococcota bacterium]|nr:SUMF1/EgtB/PvdO family nonheme iron enzyme [Myxococcota bacterium]